MSSETAPRTVTVAPMSAPSSAMVADIGVRIRFGLTDTGNTWKAGTIGVDLNYRMNDRYSLGGFVRYAGGKVDLPSVSDLKIGGVQVAGGVRIRFEKF